MQFTHELGNVNASTLYFDVRNSKMDDVVLVDSVETSRVGQWVTDVLDSNTHSCEIACDVVMPITRYDLGMRTRRELRKQLHLDLPRSIVSVEGVRVGRVDDVLRAALHPRICTQAALAPPLEWLIPHGLLAHEVGNGAFPLTADVDKYGVVTVTKRLGIRKWGHKHSPCGFVTVCIKAYPDVVVVGFTCDKQSS